MRPKITPIPPRNAAITFPAMSKPERDEPDRRGRADHATRAADRPSARPHPFAASRPTASSRARRRRRGTADKDAIPTSPGTATPTPVAPIAARKVLPATCASANVVTGGIANVTPRRGERALEPEGVSRTHTTQHRHRDRDHQPRMRQRSRSRARASSAASASASRPRRGAREAVEQTAPRRAAAWRGRAIRRGRAGGPLRFFLLLTSRPSRSVSHGSTTSSHGRRVRACPCGGEHRPSRSATRRSAPRRTKPARAAGVRGGRARDVLARAGGIGDQARQPRCEPGARHDEVGRCGQTEHGGVGDRRVPDLVTGVASIAKIVPSLAGCSTAPT